MPSGLDRPLTPDLLHVRAGMGRGDSIAVVGPNVRTTFRPLRLPHNRPLPPP